MLALLFVLIVATVKSTESFVVSSSNINNNAFIHSIPVAACTKLYMCQLLGMNCAKPTDFTFSFTGFAQRGGNTDVHSDGWGLAFYEGCGIRQFHDSNPACSSPIAALVKEYPCKTLNMLSHIRYATSGEVSLENVHPFSREMWGIQWIFAHNGDVSSFSGHKETGFRSTPCLTLNQNDVSDNDDDDHYEECITAEAAARQQQQQTTTPIVNREQYYHPIGDTDSEAMFCSILNALRRKHDKLPTLPVLYSEINQLVQQIIEFDNINGQDDDGDNPTILNFLLTCGEHVQFAYSHPGKRPGSDVWNGLYYTIREPPFSKSVQLSDCDVTIDFDKVCTDDDRVAVVATYPLTKNENWIEFQKGQLILFDEGQPHIAPEQCTKVESKGHGLQSTVLPKMNENDSNKNDNSHIDNDLEGVSGKENTDEPSLTIDSRHTVTVYGGEAI